MEVTYIRESRASYMRIGASQSGNIYRMRMVEENDIAGLLNVSERAVNDNVFYMYDISSKMSLSEAYQGKEWNYSDIIRLTDALKALYDLTEQYLLNLDEIVLDVDKIFLNSDRTQLEFCYFSGKEKTFDEEIRELFEYLIRNVCHKDSAAVTAAYGIYKRIMFGNTDISEIFEIEIPKEDIGCEVVEETSVNTDVIPEIIREEKEVVDRRRIYYPAIIAILLVVIVIVGIRNLTVSIIGSVCIVLACLFVAWYLKNKNILSKIVSEKKKIPYEQKDVRIEISQRTIDESANMTMLLTDENKKTSHYLRWEDEGGSRRYSLGINSFIVGCSAERADCVIDSVGISRMHARISKEGEDYYVKDLNSKNGTFVNGRQLACFEMCPIKHDDVIVFGNVSCVFV